jgi:hypothetical protein
MLLPEAAMARKPDPEKPKGVPTRQDLDALHHPGCTPDNRENLYQPDRLGASSTERRRAAMKEQSDMSPPKFSVADQSEMRFRRNVEWLHALGPRALAEMLEELGRVTLHMTTIERALERFAGIHPAVLRAMRADIWPPKPTLRVVGGRDHG